MEVPMTADLIGQAGLFDRAGDAGHVVTGGALEGLDVRVLAEDFLGLFVGRGLVCRSTRWAVSTRSMPGKFFCW